MRVIATQGTGYKTRILRMRCKSSIVADAAAIANKTILVTLARTHSARVVPFPQSSNEIANSQAPSFRYDDDDAMVALKGQCHVGLVG